MPQHAAGSANPQGRPAQVRYAPARSGAAFEAQRDRVMRSAERYSRFVRALKFMLPLSAFAILLATMTFVLFYDADDYLTLSFTSVGAVENDLRMVNPRFSGIDTENRPFLVTAAAAIQDITEPTIVTLETLQADMTMSEDEWFSLSANQGILDTEAETLVLEGDIAVFSQGGYEFHTNRAHVELDHQRVVTQSEITGQGPLGTLRADALTAEEAGERLLFEGNVRLRIYPPDSNASP